MLTLEQFGNLGEGIGGIAVVVTLVYLAVQVRQGNIALRHNSALIRAQVKQTSSACHNGIVDLWLTDDENRKVFYKSQYTSFEDLEANDREVCSLMFLRVMRNLGDDYHLFRLGIFAEEEWSESSKFVDYYANNQAFHGWWQSEGNIGTPEYVNYVNQRITFARAQETGV